MDNQDIFNKIKSAAENAETKDFPSMEKVWSRIDAKLDTKVENNNNFKWKILLVAASIVLIASVGYNFLISNKEINIQQNNDIVTIDTTKISKPNNQTQTDEIVAVAENANSLKNKIDKTQSSVVEPTPIVQNEPSTSLLANEIGDDSQKESIENDNNKIKLSFKLGEKNYYNTASINNNGWIAQNKFDAKGVVYTNADVVEEAKTDKIITKKSKNKNEDIVVIDGEFKKNGYDNLDEEEIDSLVELKEPLYIINGVNYSENDLFGEHPTSPYAPLNNQNIETILILQPEKAITIYGKKGEKGVVIITTKDGKPREKK